MKNIGFLSFGHWQNVPGSQARSASDSYLQAIDLAQAAEEIGIGGAYLRVHHFARQYSDPFPLLAAMAARTSRIELGTAVIDMRYASPLAMAEQAAIADLISAGRLQLGVSRGSPEPALDGPASFGNEPRDGEDGAQMARRHTDEFLAAIAGSGLVDANPQYTGTRGKLAIQPQSPGLAHRIWWGAGTRATAEWAGAHGLNLMSSTLLTEDTGVPFDQLQAEQIERFRAAWSAAGWEHQPRVSVSRSIIPITSDVDRLYFGDGSQEAHDQVGILEGVRSRFGKSYIGEPDKVAAELAKDAAVQAADTVLVTVPNQLGVDYNAHLLEAIVTHVAPVLG